MRKETKCDILKKYEAKEVDLQHNILMDTIVDKLTQQHVMHTVSTTQDTMHSTCHFLTVKW